MPASGLVPPKLMPRLAPLLLLALVAPMALAPGADSSHLAGLCPSVDYTPSGLPYGAVLIPPGGFVAGFAPECVVVRSPTNLVFVSGDAAPFLGVHPVGSARDNGACFRTTFVMTAGGNPVQIINFAYDGTTVRVDGRACNAAAILSPTEAVLPYRCFSHPTMQGVVVVKAA
jgi:hypothetical protein